MRVPRRQRMANGFLKFGPVIWLLFILQLRPCYAVPPILENPGTTPQRIENDTPCSFRITYKDDQGRAPLYIRVVVDGRWHEMVWSANQPEDFKAGVVATKSISFRTPGQNTYYYEAKTGDEKARYPASGKFSVVVVKKYVPPPPPPKPPVLSDPVSTPTTGFTGEEYPFGITYSDPDNDAPDYLRVVIDNKGRPLQWSPSRQQDYRNGIRANLNVRFDVPGDYKFYYEVKSAGMTVRYPTNEDLTITIESKSQKWILFGIGLVCLLLLTAMNFYIFFNIFRATAPKAARFAILISLVLAFFLFAYLFIHVLHWMYIGGGALLLMGLIFVLFTRQ